MTLIVTELRKWKRNKIVCGILALTILLAVFAVNRACSISRSSPYMDSFGDLYTLAFKNLTSLFLPVCQYVWFAESVLSDYCGIQHFWLL